MTATEKIHVLHSIDRLVTEIENDRTTNDILKNRYAVRFVMLDNFTEFQKLTLRLSQMGIQSFGLETLLTVENKNKWLTQDDLKTAIKGIVANSLVLPFSEIVRFYDEQKFSAFFNEIALLENTQDCLNRRIYIPLVGLHNRFSKFLDSFGRIHESAPVWALKTSEYNTKYVSIYLTNIELKDHKNYLKNMYDWFQFWKTNPTPEKIICSALPIIVNAKNAQPDNILTFINIESANDFIAKYYDLQINIPYIPKEDNFWQELLSNIKSNNFSFKSFIEEHFNIQKLTIKDFIDKWISTGTTEFDRWLLKYYYLQHIADNEYLNGITLDCADYSALRLFREIALSIFVDTNSQSQIAERNTLLNLFSQQYKLPESDLSEMKEQILNIATTDTNKAISLCSGRFDFEKELFMGWYKVGKLSLSELQNSYPDFAAYMNDLKLDGWANKYIQAYKNAKIEDKYSDEIKNIVDEKNANENSFYEWYNSNEFVLSKELLAKETVNKVYWIDGLGIEYLSLIKDIIGKSNFQIEKLKVAKTDIPSSTEHNKFESVVKIEDLDNYIHNNLYQYPQTVCKEIEIVKDIFSEILTQSAETTIAIVSDHGLTALSRLVDSKKYAAKASHEGRYIKLDSEETIEDTDYIRHKNGTDNFKVALTHASLNTKPVREVHGGCTPEEILVPFIVISNKKSARTVEKTVETKQQTDSVVSETQKKIGFEEEELF
jgi:hypothetical protein